MTNKKLAFLGLGVMGGPMAGSPRTRRACRDRLQSHRGQKPNDWVAKYGGKAAATPALAAADADIVMMCVGNDDDVRSVALGKDGALSAMSAGRVLVDHTTASADVAREVYASAMAKGGGFLDAPVSGGQAGAENGKLTVMVGGDAEHSLPRRACWRRMHVP